MCPNCRAFITVDDRVCPYCNVALEKPRRQVQPAEGVLAGFIPHARFTTMMLLLVNTALFAATVLYSMKMNGGDAVLEIPGNVLVAFGASHPALVFGYGQWWRLLTAGFLHGGLLHIGMNMWVLLDLGAQVEEVYGGARLVTLYVVSTVFGFLCSAYMGHLSVGASAALFGMIGAMIALGVRNRHHPMGRAIRGLYIRWAIYGLLFGLLPMFRMDNAAHLGGLVSGFVLAWVAGTPGGFVTAGERIWQIASYACIALTAFSFFEMYLSFSLFAK